MHILRNDYLIKIEDKTLIFVSDPHCTCDQCAIHKQDENCDCMNVSCCPTQRLDGLDGYFVEAK